MGIEEFEARLATLSEDKERVSVLLAMNRQLGSTDFLRSRKICEEAVSLAKHLDEPALQAKAHDDLANVLWKMGDNVEAQKHYHEGIRIFGQLGNYEGLSNAYCGLGIAHGSLDDSANALEYFEKGAAAAEKAGSDVMLAHNIGNQGHVYAGLEDYITALKLFARAMAINRELGEEGLQGVSNMLGAIAGVMVFQGEYDNAIAKLEESMTIDERIGNLRGKVVTLMNLGITHFRSERLPEAITYLNRSLALAEKIHFGAFKPLVHQHLAEVYEAIGDTEEALEHLKLYHDFEKAEKRLQVQRNASNVNEPGT